MADRMKAKTIEVKASHLSLISHPHYYEGIPCVLDLMDKHRIKLSSFMIGKAVETSPDLAQEPGASYPVSYGSSWRASEAAIRRSRLVPYQSNISCALQQAFNSRRLDASTAGRITNICLAGLI